MGYLNNTVRLGLMDKGKNPSSGSSKICIFFQVCIEFLLKLSYIGRSCNRADQQNKSSPLWPDWFNSKKRRRDINGNIRNNIYYVYMYIATKDRE